MAITLAQINDLVADETLGLGGRQEAGPPQEDFIPVSLEAMSMVRYYLGQSADGGGGVPSLPTDGDAWHNIPTMHPDMHYAAAPQAARDPTGQYTSLRSREILFHLKEHVPPTLLGNIPGRQATQLWWSMQHRIELALQASEPLTGATSDVVKAFNHLPREVTFQVAACMGIHPNIIRAWASSATQLRGMVYGIVLPT